MPRVRWRGAPFNRRYSGASYSADRSSCIPSLLNRNYVNKLVGWDGWKIGRRLRIFDSSLGVAAVAWLVLRTGRRVGAVLALYSRFPCLLSASITLWETCRHRCAENTGPGLETLYRRDTEYTYLLLTKNPPLLRIFTITTLWVLFYSCFILSPCSVAR